MLIAIIIGNGIGALLAFFASRWLLRAISNKVFAHEEQRRWIKWLGGIFGAISYAPSIFLAMMFGGIIGGSADRAIADVLGLGEAGMLPVLSVRLALVCAVMVTANSAIGALSGLLIARGLYRQPPPA
jgi:hypothetical protein